MIDELLLAGRAILMWAKAYWISDRTKLNDLNILAAPGVERRFWQASRI